MFRRSVLTIAMAVTVAMTVVATAAEVTFVLKSGERHSGTLVYHRDANINLRSGGNERSFPQSDIALIQFVGGDPSREEVARLPEGGDPPELDRNTVVLRNGDMIRGKVYIFNEKRRRVRHRATAAGPLTWVTSRGSTCPRRRPGTSSRAPAR
jgi:hypothetical protein